MDKASLYGPYGCASCGINQRNHGRQYGGCLSVVWAKPSDEQVKARMQARRAGGAK